MADRTKNGIIYIQTSKIQTCKDKLCASIYHAFGVIAIVQDSYFDLFEPSGEIPAGSVCERKIRETDNLVCPRAYRLLWSL